MNDKGYEKKWDDYAKHIDKKKEAPEWEVLRKARETHWREFFSVKAGQKVLDAGCGHGEYTVFALRDRATVWAFDYAPEMVKATKSRIANEGLKAEAIYVGSVTDIPHEDANFDVVFCLAVLDHLPLAARLQACQELCRVLKPGGHLYLDVPNRLAVHWRLVFFIMRLLKLYPEGKIHFFSPWEIKALVREAGLNPLASMGLTVCPPFSGIYTTNLRRITILPESVIKPLDTLYLKIEQSLRRMSLFKPFCWHYFLKSRKPDK